MIRLNRESPLSSNAKRRSLAPSQKWKNNLQRGSVEVNVGAVPLVPPQVDTAHYTLLLAAWLSNAADTVCIMILRTSISPVIRKLNQRALHCFLFHSLLLCFCFSSFQAFLCSCLFSLSFSSVLVEIVWILLIDRISSTRTDSWVVLNISLMQEDMLGHDLGKSSPFLSFFTFSPLHCTTNRQFIPP